MEEYTPYIIFIYFLISSIVLIIILSQSKKSSVQSASVEKSCEKNIQSISVPRIKIEDDNINFTENKKYINDSLALMGVHKLWKEGYDGTGIIVGVIDTGIDDTHSDLHIIKRRDYIQDKAKPSEYNIHGTHVAGIISANGKLLGAAPKVKLIDYRVLNKDGEGSYNTISTAVRDSVRDGCHIINLSLGGSYDSKDLRDSIIYAKKSGVLIVAACGNEGENSISYPAYYSQTLSVGAVEYDKQKNQITFPSEPWFSSTNNQVDVCSDGFNVVSCAHNNTYVRLSGTSMAAPHVTGFAALLIQKNGRLTDMHTLLKETTIKLPNLDKNLVGSGLVSIYGSLKDIEFPDDLVLKEIAELNPRKQIFKL